jgi:hypothetical protein
MGLAPLREFFVGAGGGVLNGFSKHDSTYKYFASEVMSFCPFAADALHLHCHLSCFFVEQGYKLLVYNIIWKFEEIFGTAGQV